LKGTLGKAARREGREAVQRRAFRKCIVTGQHATACDLDDTFKGAGKYLSITDWHRFVNI
jgi:hypothetical protein